MGPDLASHSSYGDELSNATIRFDYFLANDNVENQAFHHAKSSTSQGRTVRPAKSVCWGDEVC